MARRPRLALAGELHYVVQTGHNGQPVVVDELDRTRFVEMLRESADVAHVAVHAYALLDDALHLLAAPAEPEGLSRLMQSFGRRYGAAYNRRHGRQGGLWSGRFRCAPVEGAGFGHAAIVEVETAPVRDGLESTAAMYRWSSAAHHLGRHREVWLAEHPSFWALGNTPFERELAHAQALDRAGHGRPTAPIAAAAMRGHPVGSQKFIHRVAALSGIFVTPRGPGRPRRQPEKTVPI